MVTFVVARDQPALYDSLRREFWTEPEVQVLLDRRFGDRRLRRTVPAPERRRADRRSRWDLDAQLRTLGWAVVGA